MKLLNVIRLFLMVFILNVSVNANAQSDINALLFAGSEDANVLVEGYVAPFMRAFGVGLSGGWYNTAQAHKTAGFDLTITANMVYLPDDDLYYTPQFQNATYAPGSIQPSPTFAGPDNEVPVYEYNVTYDDPILGPITYSGQFDGPAGTGLKENFGMQAIPVPMAQLGIGIIKNTDIKIRWTPKLDVGSDGQFSLFGLGVMHDVKQHIPGIKNLPFDLSFLGAFTKVSLDYDMGNVISGAGNTAANISTTNAKSTYDISAWTFQGIISKQLSILTVYGSLGYSTSKSDLAFTGQYGISYFDPISNATATEYLVDPINVATNQNGPRISAGFRLKLLILTLHADYTLQKYSTLSAGIGFTVR